MLAALATRLYLRLHRAQLRDVVVAAVDAHRLLDHLLQVDRTLDGLGAEEHAAAGAVEQLRVAGGDVLGPLVGLAQLGARDHAVALLLRRLELAGVHQRFDQPTRGVGVLRVAEGEQRPQRGRLGVAPQVPRSVPNMSLHQPAETKSPLEAVGLTSRDPRAWKPGSRRSV